MSRRDEQPNYVDPEDAVLQYEGYVGPEAPEEDWSTSPADGKTLDPWGTCNICESDSPADELEDGTCAYCRDPTKSLQRCGACFELLLGARACLNCGERCAES